jgi:hypothetical protein
MRAVPESLRLLAVRQEGVVTRAQCVEHGLSPRQVDAFGAVGGSGRRLLPRVYLLTTGAPTRPQQMWAGLLYAGVDAQIASVTCLEVLGLKYAPDDLRVHLLLPHRRRVRSQPQLVLRRSSCVPAPQTRQGLAVTPVPRAAVDAARDVGLRQARALLAEVVQRRLTTIDALWDEVAAGPTRGAAQVRQVLRDLGSGAASAPEHDLLVLLQRSVLLPPPAVNEPLHVDGRVLVPDLCWPEARLVVEVDSVEHHGFGPDVEQTARRRAALTAAGWTVLSMSPRRIRDDPAGVLREIEAAYVLGARQQAG